MSKHSSEDQFGSDLAMLSTATEDAARAERIANLKAKYKAGDLAIDNATLASKLVDAHLQEPKAEAQASASTGKD